MSTAIEANKKRVNTENHQSTIRPLVNITRTEDAISLHIAMPGHSKAGISISVKNNTLSIVSNAERDKIQPKYIRREFGNVNYKRSFDLPKDIHQDKIDATMDQGILCITLPIKPEEKPKSITVK